MGMMKNQALNLYVNKKTPVSEESNCAACWVQGVSQFLLKKGQDQEKEESEKRTGQWEILG